MRNTDICNKSRYNEKQADKHDAGVQIGKLTKKMQAYRQLDTKIRPVLKQ